MEELKKIIADAFSKGVREIELDNVSIEAEELEFEISQAVAQMMPRLPRLGIPTIKEVEPFTFAPPKDEYKMQISEVTIGATKADGGTRNAAYTIGGETAPPFYLFEGKWANKPPIAHDVFDMPIPIPRFLKELFDDTMEDPAEWAKLRVKKFGAKMVTIHLVSTDPNVKDTSIKDAMKVVEDVLQAVKVPIIVGGSGNPEKDPELLAKAAEVCECERVVLNSVDENMDYKKVAKACIEHNQIPVNLSSMNPDEMKRLNRNMIKAGVKRDRMIMDLVTGGVGYGIEYSISAMERTRLAGLKGDEPLAIPIACAGSNAWGGREAWMAEDAWGPRELRGHLWESMTTTTALLCGTDFFMMLDPIAIKTLENVIDSLFGEAPPSDIKYESWIEMK
ncbi:MAG: CO dehydrogenase/acetyl-CoA synthase subunit delta [Candidatus Altiarchaeales archaeon WOR_SM1_79]|nr:MAG: CO dehydrogenase/acetyl-CoA synthase subunit delta [Candidatus Altiarchaeales archaeon WOR_SM1_79]